MLANQKTTLKIGIAGLSVCLLFACGEDEENDPFLPGGDADTDTDTDTDTDSDTDTDTDTDTSSTYTTKISGTVRRSVAPTAGNDGIGTMCIGIATDCPSLLNGGFVTIHGIGNAGQIDLSQENKTKPFSVDITVMTPLQGSFAIVAWLSETVAECLDTGPSNGDLITYGQNVCPGIQFQAGGHEQNVDIHLNDTASKFNFSR